METFKVKRDKSHYCQKYDDLPRFISYFYQIDIARKLQPKNILEVGIGNGTVTSYLRQQGFQIVTCDFDKSLEPDFIADIRKLPFKDASFDVVLAYEILEHLPWEDVDKALNELARVSKKNVVISLPYASLAFECVLRLPLLYSLIGKSFIDLKFHIPKFFQRIHFNGEHYWEIGWRGFALSRIRRRLKHRFRAYPSRPAALHVITPHAMCNIAI